MNTNRAVGDSLLTRPAWRIALPAKYRCIFNSKKRLQKSNPLSLFAPKTTFLKTDRLSLVQMHGYRKFILNLKSDITAALAP